MPNFLNTMLVDETNLYSGVKLVLQQHLPENPDSILNNLVPPHVDANQWSLMGSVDFYCMVEKLYARL